MIVEVTEGKDMVENTSTYRLREWVPTETEAQIQEDARHYQRMSADALEAELINVLGKHATYMDHECINLYAGTNIMNPRAVRLLASSVGSRPSLGYPGEKYEMGMQYAEQIEIMAAEVLKDIFNCDYVEFRVGSGSLANLYAYMATTNPGDSIMAFSEAAAGHVTHHTAGAAGLYKLNIHEVPYDAANMTVDLEALRKQVEANQPKLIIVGGSMCLFPYPIAEVRSIADEVGAYVMFDAAHMSGLIAGGAFQQPLAEGAHLMTSSTYKSFGGPPSGIILTNDAELAQRLDKIAYPGLTANFDLSKTAALVVAALDIREYGAAYAQMCIANAQRLARELAARGVSVHKVEGKGYTQSQHVALPAHNYGGGMSGSLLLEQANLLVSGIGLPLPPVDDDAFNAIRLGTQEITRWGMQPDDMPAVATLISRVLIGGDDPTMVKDDVIKLRAGFQQLHYVRA